jgi:hypothetical protein
MTICTPARDTTSRVVWTSGAKIRGGSRAVRMVDPGPGRAAAIGAPAVLYSERPAGTPA